MHGTSAEDKQARARQEARMPAESLCGGPVDSVLPCAPLTWNPVDTGSSAVSTARMLGRFVAALTSDRKVHVVENVHAERNRRRRDYLTLVFIKMCWLCLCLATSLEVECSGMRTPPREQAKCDHPSLLSGTVRASPWSSCTTLPLPPARLTSTKMRKHKENIRREWPCIAQECRITVLVNSC